MISIAVLITCFNRAELTLRGLQSLFAAAANRDKASITVFLVDDGCTDGTGERVKENFPAVRVITSSGGLFWNRGMRLAYENARAAGPFDAYLLYNDDVLLMPNSLARIVDAYEAKNLQAPTAILGGTLSAQSGQTSYAGFNIHGRLRVMAFDTAKPDGTLQPCDTFNGNFVLVPAREMEAVDGIDPAYHHAFGDLDLGLALRKRGCRSFLLPAPVGWCEPHPPLRPRSRRDRIRALFGPPFPLSDQIHFAFRRYPWPVAAALAMLQTAKRLVHVLKPAAPLF